LLPDISAERWSITVNLRMSKALRMSSQDVFRMIKKRRVFL
jgi:hypothetical protein